MLSRKALVFIVVGVVIVIGVVLAIVLGSKSKPSPSPPPPRPTPPNPRPPGPVPCNCPPDQECNSAGKCIPKGQCGPKTVPSGQHCPVDKLTCDSVTNKWRCNGTCDSGWEGDLCNCLSSTKPITHEVCKGQLPFCQADGSWVVSPAKNCNDVEAYLKQVVKVPPDPKNSSRSLTDIYCNTGQCSGTLTCQHTQEVVQISCASNSCSNHGTYDVSKGSCTCDHDWYGTSCEKNARESCSNHGSFNPSNSTCVCDNDWFGSNCDQNARSVCSNQGHYDVSRSACVCDSGWFGTNCEKHTDDSYTLYLVQPQVLDSKTYYSDIDYFEGRTKPQDSELANWNVDNQWKFYNNLNMIAQQFNKFATYFLKNKSLSSVQAKIKSAGGDSNGATFSARKDGGCSGYTGVITASNGANLYPATTFTFGDLSPTVTLKNDSNPYELYLLTPQGYETYKNDIKRVTSTVKDKIFNPSPDQVVHYDIDDQIWTESDDTNKIGTQVNDFVSYHLGHVNNFYVNGVLRTSGGSANGKYFRARRLDQQPDQYKISFYNSKDDVTDTRGLPCEAWCGGKINASRFAC